VPVYPPQGAMPLEPQQSPADTSLVQDYRTAWNSHGRDTINALGELLRDAAFELKQKCYWASLLNERVEALGKAAKAMDTAVAFDSKASLIEVRAKFNGMYAEYTDACLWVAKIREHEDVLGRDPYQTRLALWQKLQQKLDDRLRDMDQIPGHHETMKSYLKPVADSTLRRLLEGDDSSL
jgi:hypothetical protein